MVKSMTGFGRCEIEENNRRYTVEVKAVNHRYLELSMKMPKKLNAFESNIRALVKEYAERGKVDMFISYEDLSEEDVSIRYNKEIAAKYLQYLRQMKDEFGLEDDIRVSTLSRYPEVFTMDEADADEEETWKALEKAIRGAMKGFVEAREKEGENLKNDLLAKLDNMISYVEFIEERSPKIISEYKDRLMTKIQEMLGDTKIDEGRILTEVTIYADKVCVDEELVRLRSHVVATRDTLAKGGAVGRKLDFLAQEMNREANTILSKSTDLEISDRGILLKTDIEKVREQIQNLE